MRLRLVSAIITVLLIVSGLVMISPLFLKQGSVEPKQKLMVTFGVVESANVMDWCKSLSSILNTYNMPATVFIVGRVAEQYSQAALYFSDNVDIGSQTYDNTNLTSISDYTLKLEEVEKGKAAVDSAGHLNSMVFRAPYRTTDQDIYSILSRAGILADFSYKHQYNVYLNGQFIKFDSTTFEGRDYSPDFFLTQNKTSLPLIIDFDNTYPTSSIESYLSRLKTGNFNFVNASELVGFSLTIRRSQAIAPIELLQVAPNFGRGQKNDSHRVREHLLSSYRVGK